MDKKQKGKNDSSVEEEVVEANYWETRFDSDFSRLPLSGNEPEVGETTSSGAPPSSVPPSSVPPSSVPPTGAPPSDSGRGDIWAWFGCVLLSLLPLVILPLRNAIFKNGNFFIDFFKQISLISVSISFTFSALFTWSKKCYKYQPTLNKIFYGFGIGLIIFYIVMALSADDFEMAINTEIIINLTTFLVSLVASLFYIIRATSSMRKAK